MTGRKVLAVGRRSQIPDMGTAQVRGYLSTLTAWQLVSPRANDPREASHHIFYDRPSEVTSIISIISYWLYRSALLCLGGDYTGRGITGETSCSQVASGMYDYPHFTVEETQAWKDPPLVTWLPWQIIF